MKIINLDTPALLVDKRILLENIKRMAELAQNNNVKLRPHIKAHKCTKIAKLQIAYGAQGITVAKLSEGEVMFKAGINDILIAFQIVNREKLARLKKLIVAGAKITCLVDNLEQAKILNDFGKENDIFLETYVEIDSGLKRTGITPREIVDFVKGLHNFTNLKFTGILTHAGHVYSTGKDQVAPIGREEGLIMETVARDLHKSGFSDFEVSVGSTPTVKYSGQNQKVTEIRPGNYVFNDGIQLGLGVANYNHCSFKVLATVISKPSPDRLVIDAGSKTLALDKGAHGAEIVKGFGIITEYPQLTIQRLSEEHGIVEVKGDKVPQIGEKLSIIPNHACTVVNLADQLILTEGNQVIDRWEIDARGKNK